MITPIALVGNPAEVSELIKSVNDLIVEINARLQATGEGLTAGTGISINGNTIINTQSGGGGISLPISGIPNVVAYGASAVTTEPGGDIGLYGGNAASNRGGILTFKGGDGGGHGGGVYFSGGNSVSASGGGMRFIGGNTTSGLGGVCQLAGGGGAYGGGVYIDGGQGTTSLGGQVVMLGGPSVNDGGGISLTGGSGAVNGGNVIVTPGPGATAGNVILRNLPVSDPGIVSALWVESGFIRISP